MSQSIQEIKRELERLGISPSKLRGQNFLLDQNFCNELIALAKLSNLDHVLEVGPGMGVLTAQLLHTVASVHLVEIEREFCDFLGRKFPQIEADRILCADARTLSLARIRDKVGAKLAVVGNVPYSISTDLLFWLFENRDFIDRACFLFQREFAERIAAGGGVRESGVISLMCELNAEAELGPIVTGDNFYPPAKVDSRLVYLRLREHPRKNEIDFDVFKRVVRSAFSKRRKTLLNSLSGSEIGLEKEAVAEVLASAKIDPKRRAETLTFDEFVDLAKTVGTKN